MKETASIALRPGNARYAWVIAVLFGLLPAGLYLQHGPQMFLSWWGWATPALPAFYLVRSVVSYLECLRLRLTATELLLERRFRGINDWRCRQTVPRPSKAFVQTIASNKDNWPEIGIQTSGGALRWVSEDSYAASDVEEIRRFLTVAGVQVSNEPVGDTLVSADS